MAILETPYRSFEGQKGPAQFAHAVDPNGILADLTLWLDGLAESLEVGPSDVVGVASATLRRAAGRYAALLSA